MKNNKKAYLAPMVEVMNARVEKGFAGSGSTPSGQDPFDPTGHIINGVNMTMNTNTNIDFD